MSIPTNVAQPISSSQQPQQHYSIHQSYSQPVLNSQHQPTQQSNVIHNNNNLNTLNTTNTNTTTSPTSNIDIPHNVQSMIRQIDSMYNNNTDKINSELIALTYGSFIQSVINDFDDNVDMINNELYSIGTSIGKRLIDDFLAKTQPTLNYNCNTFYDTMIIMTKIAFKYYLGINAGLIKYNEINNNIINNNNSVDNTNDNNNTTQPLATCIMQFNQCPLYTFITNDYANNSNTQLQIGNILCGIICGSLQQLNLNTKAIQIQSQYTNEQHINQIEVQLINIIQQQLDNDE